jgi:hypothetical protein
MAAARIEDYALIGDTQTARQRAMVDQPRGSSRSHDAPLPR